AAAWQGAADVPAVIEWRGARRCTLQDCRVENVGWYAVELEAGCIDNRIVGNELVDLGGGGIKLNGAGVDGARDRRTGNNRVTDNHIHRAGRVFHSAAGILARHTYGNLIAHNHIHDLYHNGINVGWVWSFYDSIAGYNIVEYNHIHDLGHGVLSDMGCVYVLGGAPGNVIRGNHCHDVHGAKYGGWGIYLDEGSSHVIVEDNVVHHLGSECFHVHWGRENVVRNNVFAFGADSVIAVSRVSDDYSTVTFTRNVLVTDGPPIYLGGYKHDAAGSRAFESDLNLVWDLAAGAAPAAARNKTNTAEVDAALPATAWSDWTTTGRDVHSVVADPRFADPRAGDFALPHDSPARSIGFVAPDVSRVGPRRRRNDDDKS
ncbi:MAG TPA: right-handed parallel beta-helix repeat-containing protein, partial [Tepidisphaeraceae bacterium]|nr:right-handed parallel beta-helix repeat-containing protein [Tepidisphaeraceae bacterium]